MKKKLFRLLLILCLILGLTLTAASEEPPTSGKLGDAISWVLSEDGTLTISGTGPMPDEAIPFSFGPMPIKKVVIEEGITDIGKVLFQNCTLLEEVSFPESLENIRAYSFSGCVALKEVVFPQGLIAIEEGAFSECDLLTEILIPDSVLHLGEHAFSHCDSLEKAHLGAGIRGISRNTFFQCEKLKEIQFDGQLEAIMDFAFARTGFERFIVPDTVNHIGGWAFNGCKELVHFDTGNGKDLLIGERVWTDCEKLESLTVGSGIAEIGYPAVENSTNLTKLNIRDLESWCTAIVSTDILTQAGNLYVNDELAVSLVIPGSVRVVGNGAFSGCTSLVKVVLETGITGIDSNAFRNCTALTTVTLPATLTEMGSEVFSGCSSLTAIDIPEGIVRLDGWFFADCINLTDVTLPSTLHEVTSDPFSNCTSLKAIKYRGTKEQWDAIVPSFNTGWKEGRTVTFLNAAPAGFDDVIKGFWYYDSVTWAVNMGITTGTSATTFSPDAPCTRGQVVTFLWRAAGSPQQETTKNRFTDVKEGDYYYDAVQWAVEYGITTGTSDTTFSPDLPCTRAQVATFLWRTAGQPEAEFKEHSFTDIEADYYYDAVLWAVDTGITFGMTSTTFAPAATCSRAQIVTFLHRFLG